MKLATLLTTLLLALAAPAQAVDEGAPDRDRHPAVGLLGFDVDGGGPIAPAFLCSGSVLSDRLFLTAAHCIPAVPPDVEWVVVLAAGSPATPVMQPGVFPDDFPFALTVPARRGGVATMHPRFDAETRKHDIAVVRFPAGTFAAVEPMELPSAKLLDRRGLRHRQLRLVGYGADPEFGDGDPVFVVEGYRQAASAPFLALTRRQLLLDGDAAATGRGGLCLGDSGSPQLLGESGPAVSLLSAHADDCRGPLMGQRLDTRPARRFLSRFVELP